MDKYVILAESGADLPKDIIEQYGIYVIPMHVTFGDETKADGTFPTTELFNYYKTTGSLPKTAACNAAEFGDIYDEIHAKHPDKRILYLAYSSVTTSTYHSGVMAAEDRDYVTTFDTKHCSAGQAFVITMICRYIESHPEAELSEILEAAKDYSERTRMGFFPGDLDYLRAGGRVSNAAYMGAKLLSLNPLIEIQNGYLVATKKYRGKMERIATKLLTDFTKSQNLGNDIVYLVFSRGLSQKIMDQVVEVAKNLGYQEIRWVETGCVVSTHSGPGAFGVIGLSK